MPSDYRGTHLHLAAGDDALHLPFVINVRDLSDAQTRELMVSIADGLGARHFRDLDLDMEVLKDQREAASQPLTWLYGPYVAVIPKDNGTLRLTSVQEVEGGFTVYATDQIETLLDAVRADRQKSATPDDSPSP